MESRWFTAISLVVLVGGAAVCLWVIAGGGTTGRESVLLGLFLTFLSTMASWIASRYYAEYSFNKNLRIFALKAAEKVNNLSQELDRLTVYLQQELDATDLTANTTEALRLKDARIESAIHIINTLKSVNDRSLSDWEGVIGEELDAQERRREQQQAGLKELVTRLEALYATHLTESAGIAQGSAPTALELEVESLKQDLGALVAQVSGVTVRRGRSARVQRETVRGECPQCGATIRYRQRPIPNSVVNVTCSTCDAHLYSRFSDGDFLLRSRDPIVEVVNCPTCGLETRLEMDPVPGGAPAETVCRQCGAHFRVSRTVGGVGIRPVAAAMPGNRSARLAEPEAPTITEAVLERVREQLPPQPWPTGTTRRAAEKLGLPLPLVNDAVEELIRRQVFYPQVDGVVASDPAPVADTPSLLDSKKPDVGTPHVVTSRRR